MPYINIRLGTAVNIEQKQQLFDRTTSLMNTVMRKRREVTVVHLDESDPQLWATNATPLSADVPVGAYVEIKITAGTNTAEQKAEMLDQTVVMLKDVVGTLQEACYVVIEDIPADSWGYNGVSQAARAVPK